MEHLEKALRKYNIKDVVLVLDEADNMWTNTPDLNRREQAMYKMLTDHRSPETTKFTSETIPTLLKHSRIRSYVQVSATHLSTVVWHTMRKLPFKAIIADTHDLQDKGYMLPTDFDALEHLTMDEASSPRHLMESPKVGVSIDIHCKDVHGSPWHGTRQPPRQCHGLELMCF